VSHGFFLGIYPVTQAQWFAVMGSDPSTFKGAERPVETVYWEDCQEFCTKLRGFTGRCVELPTDAEWEYACRAGTTTDYHFGDTINTDLANYDGMTEGAPRKETTPVGSFPANAWGLFDVHGNVWEWCADEYKPYAPRGSRGSEYDGCRLVRGGSWYDLDIDCPAAYRYPQPVQEGDWGRLGLRVCLRRN
jgi:formylglycine-generating enzyme required for sulfatase activity